VIEYSPMRSILILRTWKYVSSTTYSAISFSVHSYDVYIPRIVCRFQRSIEMCLNFCLIRPFFSSYFSVCFSKMMFIWLSTAGYTEKSTRKKP